MENPVVIVRLLGGLGNQLFQYAFGRGLSIKLGRSLKLDLSFYNNQPSRWAIRSYVLNKFHLNAQLATPEELRPFQKYLGQNISSKILRRLTAALPAGNKAYIFEPVGENFVFHKNIYNINPAGTIYLDGFWQTEKYFSDIEDIIRKDLEFVSQPDADNKIMLDEIALKNSVSIHIRHGDNATKVAAHHGILPLDYYSAAVDKISQFAENPHFYIFSDDPVWAKKNLKLKFSATFVTHNGDERQHEDLRLMSRCKHHIIGNSTFSWWGAWLGKREGQLVFAPSRYHINAKISMADYYPTGWNIIPIDN